MCKIIFIRVADEYAAAIHRIMITIKIFHFFPQCNFSCPRTNVLLSDSNDLTVWLEIFSQRLRIQENCTNLFFVSCQTK